MRLLAQLSNSCARRRVGPIAASSDVTCRDVSACGVSLPGSYRPLYDGEVSVLAGDASEHRFAFADINQQRRTDVERPPAARRRSDHLCHVKDAQDVVRAPILQIIVGRLVFKRSPAVSRKCGRNGWARSNCGADGNAQTIMAIWRQHADRWNEFIGPLTTELRERSA